MLSLIQYSYSIELLISATIFYFEILLKPICLYCKTRYDLYDYAY